MSYPTERITNLKINLLRAETEKIPFTRSKLDVRLENICHRRIWTPLRVNPAHVFTVEMGLEFVDFCLDCLERDIMSDSTHDMDMELDCEDEEFAVSFHFKLKQKELTDVLVIDCQNKKPTS